MAMNSFQQLVRALDQGQKGTVMKRISPEEMKVYLKSIKAPSCEVGEEDFGFLRAGQGNVKQAVLALEKRAHYVA